MFDSIIEKISQDFNMFLNMDILLQIAFGVVFLGILLEILIDFSCKNRKNLFCRIWSSSVEKLISFNSFLVTIIICFIITIPFLLILVKLNIITNTEDPLFFLIVAVGLMISRFIARLYIGNKNLKFKISK